MQEFQVHDLGCPILSCDVVTLKCPTIKRIGSDGSVEYSTASSCCKEDSSDIKENKEVSADCGAGTEAEGEEREACLFIACLGDTAGTVSVWVLAGSIVPCGLSGDAWYGHVYVTLLSYSFLLISGLFCIDYLYIHDN
jgi:hypothetical protein